MIIDVALNIPLLKTFHYKVPEELEPLIVVGKRVVIPFGRKKTKGVIIEILKKSEFSELKEIIEVMDDEEIISTKLLALAKWISDYYVSSLGEVIFGIISFVNKKHTKQELLCVEERMVSYKPYVLTPHQKIATETILASFLKSEFKVFLLYGVTGSGKTEIYLNAIEKALEKDRGVIYLVPEIALTHQLFNALNTRFPGNVSMIHSKMTPKERQIAWESLKSGKTNIALGARSVVFAPLKNIGLIIVDEEHEPSYKQEDSPRYNARDVAVVRAKIEECKIILGSATPSLESLFNVEKKKYELLELPERITGSKMPKISIIDMRYSPWKSFMFSRVLYDKVLNCLNRKEQVILFLNKRGSSSVVLCKSCGHVFTCKRCDLSLVYHKDKNALLCHYCGYSVPFGSSCVKCKGVLEFIGMGTQKLEENIKDIFKGATVERLDTDAIGKKGTCEKFLEDFKNNKIDILIGTQMVAKGLDFHNVTLVGVISTDLMLNLPDFRSHERAFQLITQVAGRSGRGAKAGEVVVQCFNPENYSIQYAAQLKSLEFYKRELEERKRLSYPPYTKMIEIILKGTNEKNVNVMANNIYNKIRTYIKNNDIVILGPSPMPISYINKFYRWHLLLKAVNQTKINHIAKEVAMTYNNKNGVKIFINVDPVNMI